MQCASQSAKRYITKSDDEWSVALSAFCEAVRQYKDGKGSFKSFASMVIRRRILDYISGRQKYNNEILAAPEVFASGPLDESEQPALQAAVAKKLAVSDNNDIAFEIEAANSLFANYGFTFFDLAACSPKAEKTKSACAKAAVCVLENSALLKSMKTTHALPIKLISEITQVPRKILDRHRRYIIAAVEILSGDYPALARYMRFIRKEMKG